LFVPQKIGKITKLLQMSREVQLKLESLLNERAPEIPKAKLAKRLGIADGTLRGLLENRWTVLDRTLLERLADFFQCDIASLLTTTESPFFDPFRAISRKEGHAFHPTCLFLRRPDANNMQAGRPAAYRDNEAMKFVSTLLRDCVDEYVDTEDAATTREQFDQHFSQNCLVVGSPRVNPASELAICRVFGAEPFTLGQHVRIPFTFRTADAASLGQSSIVEASPDGKLGIWLRDAQELLKADTWPREKFRKLEIQKGRDCGLILVLNHALQDPSKNIRKLVVLSGFSGMGTEAAAKALVDHYRDLEPRDQETYVWGLIEVFYSKPGNSMSREFLGYNWRCRIGGRCPIDFAKRAVANQAR
jgi:hypothetical protein